MPLRITKSTDTIEVKTLTTVIYGPPGHGKTTFAFTAEKPLLLDFDHGVYRAGNRGDAVQVETWADVTQIQPADLTDYRTVIVDTAGRALDVLTADIIAVNPKHGRGGALTLQGYGELRSRFIAWTKYIRGFGLDVVLVAHSDEQRQGDDVIERLDVQGGSKNEIYKAADVMGRLYIHGNKRMLNFSPTDTTFGKNPAQLSPLEVPHFTADTQFLGGVIARIKGELNKQSAAQQKASSAMADWKAKLDEVTSPEELNALLPAAKEADSAVRDNVAKLFQACARRNGFALDKKDHTYSKVGAAAA